MAKLTRVTGKVFAGSAQLTDLGVFGSAKSGTPTNPTGTGTEAQIQADSAYDEGWTSAVVTSKNFPPIEEVNGVLRTISYQTCYLLQEGIPEYDIGTEYSNTSIVKSISGSNLSFYISLQNGNKGNALSDTNYWVKAIPNAADKDLSNLSATGELRFTNKANTDLSNMSASQSAINTIVGWGMPDYSAGASKSVNTTYTASKDCFVHFRNYVSSSYPAVATITVYNSNGTEIFKSVTTSANVSDTSSSVGLFIPKGYKYQCSAGTGNHGTKTIYEFPLKGVSA